MIELHHWQGIVDQLNCCTGALMAIRCLCPIWDKLAHHNVRQVICVMHPVCKRLLHLYCRRPRLSTLCQPVLS